MRLLLIDNSNTRTKFALAEGRRIVGETHRLATAELSPETLEPLLDGLDFDAALVASVVPEKAALLREQLTPRGEVAELDHRSPLGIGIDFPRPERIGADRLANAVGVTALHGAPAIVIDFGTAVTFDVVKQGDTGPAYCGGVIAPGLGAMSDYLGRRTALLPAIELHEPERVIGRSTAEAMTSGAVIGYRGLVREILASVRRELGGPARAVATGGDAELIARGVDEIDAVDPMVTLEGLRLVAERVFPTTRP